MNTSKQVNVMIGLLFVGAIGTLLYFLWDSERETAATGRQLQVNAERGGKLFSLNCRACHGLNGLGALESSALPGLPLNTDANREADKARQDYLRATIKCGRVGTRMPAWATENGGSLNDFQIDQLMALITGTMTGFDQDPQASVDGWNNAIELANHADEFVPAKHLSEAATADATTLVLDNARSLRPGQGLRIDDSLEDPLYEVVTVVDTPADSTLRESAESGDTELVLDDATVFKPGDTIIVDTELIKVLTAPGRSVLAKDLPADATTVEVLDGKGFQASEFVLVGIEKMQIISVSGNTLVVRRAADESVAVDHAADSAIFETGVADKLAQDATSDTTKLVLNDGTGFAKGQVVEVGREKMLVTLVSGNNIDVQRAYDGTTAKQHPSGSPIVQLTNVLGVERGVEGTGIGSHDIKTQVFETGFEITVKRAAFGTKAAAHVVGAEVFNGPITPPDSITGSAGNPPCGQLPAQTAAPVADVAVSGSANVAIGDNFFDVGGNHNPTFNLAAGSGVTFNLTNGGKAPHNMRVAGPDGQFDTGDDSVSNPDVITPAGTATLQFTGAAGTYNYRCDFHADAMHGQIKAE